MNKVVLKFEIDLDFILIAITSPLKDYRLCYFINKRGGYHFSKVDDHEVYLPSSKSPNYFSRYEYANEDRELAYYLIANRAVDGGWLVPEMKHSDYFIIIKSFIDEEDLELLKQQLNDIEEVLTANEILPEKLKSKENLIF